MPLSSKIIKGSKDLSEYMVLELRKSFLQESVEETPAEEVETDPSVTAALIIGEAEEKAGRILAEAMARARKTEEEIVGKAEGKAKELFRASREKGLEEGRKEALARAAADASSIREQARTVLRQAEEIRRRSLESLETEIINLAVDIAEKIVMAELKQNPRSVVDVAKEAIDLLRDRDQLVLYVNPEDVALFEERRPDLTKHLSPGGELHIIADSDISPGGCVAETEFGRVDATLDTRWEGLIKSLGEIGR